MINNSTNSKQKKNNIDQANYRSNLEFQNESKQKIRGQSNKRRKSLDPSIKSSIINEQFSNKIKTKISNEKMNLKLKNAEKNSLDTNLILSQKPVDKTIKISLDELKTKSINYVPANVIMFFKQ